MQKQSCIFCRIGRREAPASIVYEDEEILAFMDTRPMTEGHMLVIPKKHYENIFDISEELNAKVHKVVKQISLAVRKATKADGISIIQQNGRAAGQEVFHLHVHVIPRYEGQKLPRFGETPNVSREELDRISTQIKLHL
jgi:histidine triad (HIT) family protein